MRAVMLKDGLYALSPERPELRTFREGAVTELGMKYSSYALDTADGILAIGTVPARYAAEWARALGDLAGERGVKRLVLLGVDGDLPSLRALRERFPEVTVYAGERTLYDLTAAGESPRRAVLLRGDRELVLGDRRLRFTVITGKREAPGVTVRDPASGALFCADILGSDCALGVAKVSELADKGPFYRGAALYFAGIYGPRRPGVVRQMLELARGEDVTMICPAFGPVIDQGLEELFKICTPRPRRRGGMPRVLVAYTPGGGTAELAGSIAGGLEESRALDVELLDLSQTDYLEAAEALSSADAVLLGVSGSGRDMMGLLTRLDPEDCRGKYASVFHTGGPDSPLPGLVRPLLTRLGFDLNGGDHCSTGAPSPADRKAAYEYGFGFGCLIRGVPNPRKPALVKCLVCGEIFDASLGVCPVCGVGLDQCVPVPEDQVTFRRDTDRRYVIIGGGIAGVSAAEAIRQRDRTGRVLILSAERELPINRPMLTKDLEAIRTDPGGLALHGAEWYEKRNIELRTGETVTAIDPLGRTVTTSGGQSFPYDKLIYAAGAECFVPPFEGRDKAGVLTVRHLEDAQKLIEKLKTAKTAVVIGGGVLGLEAAAQMVGLGVKVTVLEASPQIIGRQADPASAKRLREIMGRFGVACLEGVSIAAVTGETKADGVALADGRRFPADVVVVSCGNRANVAPAKAAGIRTDRAILVNARMETNLPDIYACGDCAELEDVNFQLWSEASQQGKTAGANAAGEPVLYRNGLFGLSLEGFGTSLFAIGDPGKRPGVRYGTVETLDGVRGRTERYWTIGERLEGAVLIGAPEKIPDITRAVAEKAPYDEIRRVSP